MGFNIKNNYGPNIEVKDGGKLTLVQGKDGMWHTADAEDAEYEEVVEDAEEVSAVMDNDGNDFVPDEKAIEKCFRFNNDFVKRSVSTLVTDFYQGNYANLALIEITLFHHQQLKRRNSHKAFVMSLAAWGIITIADDKEFDLIVMGVGDKYKRLPKEGYKEWDDKDKDDKLACERIGKKLGPTMAYQL